MERGAAEAALRAQARVRPATRAGELRVVVVPLAGEGAEALPLAALERLGARVEARSRSLARISATPEVLARAAELADIGALRFPFTPIPVDGSGSIVSESVALVGASALQAAGVDGTGVHVAVIDSGFRRLAEAKAAGEIPASAISVDLVGNGMEVATAHGTGVAEQVADVAPGAQLHLILFEDEVDFENAADYVRDQGIRIANLSVNWFGTSYYDDTGPINAIVNRSNDDDGVLWAVGGGNWAFRHWRGGWLDADADNTLEFAAADEQLGLIAEVSQICVTLNWNQYPGLHLGVRTNLDLFVHSTTGAQVASSTDNQTAGAPPIELACFPRVGAQEPYHVRVRRISGTTVGLDMTVLSSDAAIEIPNRVAGASLVDPAVAHGAFAIGAVNHTVWNNLPWPPIEAFSSQGPTTDGRPKPDLVAPNRTASLTYPVAQGTSFAAPVVAGAAALLLDQDPSLSNQQLRAALVAAANPAGAAGKDNVFGWGTLVATPFVGPADSDDDGTPDAADLCPFAAEAVQADANGDGIGDACQCGDADASHFLNAADVTALRQWLARAIPTLPVPALCNVHGPASPNAADCRIDDATVLRRALVLAAPGIGQVCAPALPK